MRYRIACLSVSLSIFTLTSSAPAQTGGAAANQLTFDVVVTQHDGQPVAGLAATDFTLLDNKVNQSISSFRALGGEQDPVQVVLLVDAVNVDYSQLAFERQQLDKFLSANDGRLAQPTSIAIMTDTNTQFQPHASRDGNGIRRMFDNFDIGLRQVRRSAGFYGAAERFQTSLEAMHRMIAHEATVPGRKLIIYLSPGWPLLSGPGVELSTDRRRAILREIVALSTQLREAHITIDAVNPLGTGEDPGQLFYYQQFLKAVQNLAQVYPGDLGLQVLAVQSGGLVLNGNNDIASLLQHCFDQTRSGYEISFASPPSEGPNEFHALELKVTRPGLTVHSRNGYYAGPVTGTGAIPVSSLKPEAR